MNFSVDGSLHSYVVNWVLGNFAFRLANVSYVVMVTGELGDGRTVIFAFWVIFVGTTRKFAVEAGAIYSVFLITTKF